MPEDSGGQAFLVGLLLTTLVLGAIVLAAKTDYRFEPISISNEDYYSNVPLTSPEDDDEAAEDASTPPREDSSSSQPGDKSLQGIEKPQTPRKKAP